MITEFWVNFPFKGHAKTCQHMKGRGSSNRVICMIRNRGLVDPKSGTKDSGLEHFRIEIKRPLRLVVPLLSSLSFSN